MGRSGADPAQVRGPDYENLADLGEHTITNRVFPVESYRLRTGIGDSGLRWWASNWKAKEVLRNIEQPELVIIVQDVAI